jgi:hypothetical protein
MTSVQGRKHELSTGKPNLAETEKGETLFSLISRGFFTNNSSW